MKTQIRFLGCLFFIFILELSGCLEEKFIPDSDHPNLPKYTEDGNQVGGALVNNIAWKTDFAVNFDGPTRRSFYFTNSSNGDSLTIHLDGIFNEGTLVNRPLSFAIFLKGFQLKSIDDLRNLKGKVFALDGTQNQAACIDWQHLISSDKEKFYGGTGHFTIKNVKPVSNLTYTRTNGTKYNPLIISGIFEFEFKSNALKIELGRFDFQVIDSDIDSD